MQNNFFLYIQLVLNRDIVFEYENYIVYMSSHMVHYHSFKKNNARHIRLFMPSNKLYIVKMMYIWILCKRPFWQILILACH